MPFPTPKQTEWPYSKWKPFSFMKKSSKCEAKFFSERLEKLENRFHRHCPKLVIFYGRCDKYEPFLGVKWKSVSIEIKKKFKFKFHWVQVNYPTSKRKSLICRIPHPSYLVRFGGGCTAIKNLACKIKKLLGDRVAVRRGE
jgi:hypothetical protein